ncbi:MAG TPA: ABC transporter substrate-binding protein [Chloroflexota bacterium]|nr:ABC transporter substrate-binding protein [Chloroflexota bacterium]
MGSARGRGLAALAAVLLTACGASAPAAPAAGPAAATAAPAAAAASPAPTPLPPLDVTVAIPANSLSQFPLALGKEAGIYEQRGINLSINAMATNAAIAGAISGSVDYATPAGSLIRAIASGAPLRVVMTMTDRSTHLLLVNPATVPDGAALAGKRIAINSPGDNTDLEAQAALQHFGLDKKDYSSAVIPDDAPKLAALQANAVDAAIISIPFNFRGEALGFKVLLNFVQVYEQPTAVLATTLGRIAGQPAAVQRMVDATLAATQYTRTQPAAATRLIGEVYNLEPAQADAAYELVKESWSATGVLSDTAYQNATEPLDLSPPPPRDTVVDDQFVNAAHAGS